MSKPRMRDMVALKRVGCYLRRAPRASYLYTWKPLDLTITTHCDADFVGCHESRKSTVGGVICFSGHFVKAWSKTMTVLALSSGESESGAMVKASTESLGVQSMLLEFGIDTKITVISDASAALGIVKRVGLGKVRDLHTADLWIQQRVNVGDIAVGTVDGKLNP